MDIRIKVGVVVIDKDDRVLLIKEKSHSKGVSLWNVVKGTHEGGETIFDAAKRECLEEASVDVKLLHALGAFVSERSEKIRVQFNFLALALGTPKVPAYDEQTLRGEVIEEVRWFTKDEISTMTRDEFISTRAMELLSEWSNGKVVPLETYRHVEL